MMTKKQKAYQLTILALLAFILLSWLQVLFSDKSILAGLIWKTLLAIPLLMFIPAIKSLSKNGIVWYSFVSLGYLTWISSGLIMKFEVIRFLGFLALLISFSASLMLARWRNI